MHSHAGAWEREKSMNLRKFSILILAFTMALTACGIAKVYETEMCFETATPTKIIESGCPAVSLNLMVVAEDQCLNNCGGEPKQDLPTGEELQVKRILIDRLGAAGSCRRIIGEIHLEGSIQVEIPSCFIHHPSSWFEEPSSGEPDKLVPKTKFLRRCS